MCNLRGMGNTYQFGKVNVNSEEQQLELLPRMWYMHFPRPR
jgi:hypothetical protein